MYVKTGTAIDFVAFFVSSRVGKTGITVQVDVYEWRSGSVTKVVSASPATEVGGGLYGFRHITQSDCTAIAIFKTADVTVDSQNIPAMALDPAKETTLSLVENRVSSERMAKIDEIDTRVGTNLDMVLSDLPDLVSATISSINGEEIAQGVLAAIYSDLAKSDAIIMGQGSGSVVFDTSLEDFEDHRVLSSNRTPVRGVVVRAFSVVNEEVDWDSVKARHETNQSGDFLVYLDPGEYILSYEKNGVQINTGRVTVVAPTP